jgi:hypothetical protein
MIRFESCRIFRFHTNVTSSPYLFSHYTPVSVLLCSRDMVFWAGCMCSECKFQGSVPLRLLNHSSVNISSFFLVKLFLSLVLLSVWHYHHFVLKSASLCPILSCLHLIAGMNCSASCLLQFRLPHRRKWVHFGMLKGIELLKCESFIAADDLTTADPLLKH